MIAQNSNLSTENFVVYFGSHGYWNFGFEIGNMIGRISNLSKLGPIETHAIVFNEENYIKI